MSSLREVLAQAALALEPVHVPRPETEVRWVAVSELVDPSPFLEGGEVLLTTGLDTRSWEGEWAVYVGRLADAGVAGLGLGVGLTYPSVPEALTEACIEHGVNLFAVPTQTTFVSVSRTVARLLQHAEQVLADRALELQRELTEAALHERDVETVIGRLAAGIGGSAAMVSPEGETLEDPVGPRTDLLDLEVVVAEVERMRGHGLRAAASLSTLGGTTLAQPVGVRGRPSAFLVVAVPGRVGNHQRSAVMTAVALLGLAAERAQSRRETDRRLRARALEMLLRGDDGTARLLLEARTGARRWRWPNRLAVTLAAGPAESCELAMEAVETRFDLTALVRGRLVVAAPAPEVAKLLGAFERFPALRVAVGERVAPVEIQRSLRTAEHAMAGAPASSRVADWQRNVQEGALSLVDPQRADAFADSFLAPLRGEQEEDLLDTLQSFLRHHGSLVRVAAELNLHRNTVRNRVAHLEKALGRSFDDPQTRVDAWLALQAWVSSPL